MNNHKTLKISVAPPFLGAYFIMLSGATYLLFSKIEGTKISATSGDSLLYQFAWIVLYIVLLIKLAQHAKTVAGILRHRVAWPFFIISAIASYVIFLPNDLPVFTKFAMYVMTILFGLWLSAAVTPDRFFAAAYALSIAILIIHWAAFPFVGNTLIYDLVGRDTVLGTLSYGGLFGHKNLAGAFFGFATIVAMSRSVGTGMHRNFTMYFVMVAQFVTLATTGAAGPLISTVTAGAVAFGVFLTSRRSPMSIIWWYMMAGIAAAIAIFGYMGLLGAVGRESGFTGRSFLLGAWPQFFFQHPLFGFGYARFFSPTEPFAAQLASMTRYSTYVSFESSYLDIGIAFGLVGGFFLGIILFRALLNSYRFLYQEPPAVYQLAPFAVVTFILLSSVSDPTLGLHNHFYSAIVFWTYFGMRKHAPQGRTSNAQIPPHIVLRRARPGFSNSVLSLRAK